MSISPTITLLRAFGARILRWRTGSGLTQTDASTSCGCSLSTFRRWEAGEALPSANFLALLFALSDGELYLSAEDVIPFDTEEDA